MPSTETILDEFGVALDVDGGLDFVNMARAEAGYVHHSRMPVALAAIAAISPAFARGRFPKVRLTDLVAKRPAMDEDEAVALAAVGGADARPPFWGRQDRFHAFLLEVIDRHAIGHLFLHDVDGHGLMGFRPLGYVDDTRDADLKRFRAAIKCLNEGRRIMVATIITLYRGDAERDMWRKGGWANWHAADALAILSGDTQLRADWHKLVALYPGW